MDPTAPAAPHLPHPPQIYRLRTPNSPTSPKICRDTVALLLQVTGHPELRDTAGLLVSELVTNVGRHTGSLAVRLEAVVRHDRVRVAVYDDEPARPPAPSARPAPDHDSDCGRGLLLVEAMATAWGVGAAHPSSLAGLTGLSDPSNPSDLTGAAGLGGKHVWFELLDRPGRD
ncbi:Histidine kinase-like ATPase domain-containing protein [Streptomyces sp. yr375]|uniref:ATP-binding protein n=1 Tax=Streptomyces sp. yr375 TaxID=1761906 RepID=UPI0008BEBD61|nr:ATP-binding protein [Streptomyces sp. yr375]SES47598.1 Histidine kinase-like ATPase domain-containing protein [Streptomyces sp. yr375]